MNNANGKVVGGMQRPTGVQRPEPISRRTRAFGWIPDVPDHRDHLFGVTAPTTALPKTVPALGRRVPIDDQGELSSCTGNATAAALQIVTGCTARSRLMAYYDAREIEGTTATDDGAMLRDVMKAATKLGVGGEDVWPYDVDRVCTKPTPNAYADGLLLIPRVASYQRVTSFLQLRKALASGLPVVFGFAVPDYFESDEVAAKGWVRLPKPSDPIIGGHAVVAVGYSMATNPYVIVRNSWGAEWGLNGHFKMAAAWFTDKRRLVDDLWCIRPAK